MDWGNGSDLISAACNAVMAGVAVYAAANAKDWLSPKLNERKFKFADELIDQFCRLQQESFYLHSDVKQLINTEPDEQHDEAKFRLLWEELLQKEAAYRKNIINLRTAMERMDLWGLQPINERLFIKIIDSHLSLTYAIRDALSVGSEEIFLKLPVCFDFDMMISEKYRTVRASHNNIIKHYSELFTD
ncbi:hypothetical protein ABK836_16395 [Enterobacter hormaechei]|uniref:hypothetical protein n=1 Tax=Enterobacter hormaechei TaxID=158836 RepID=UPI0005F2565B|nr:hypothetical protein [Enterobacter hormaechei]QLU71427.1 hypothetical protein HV217_08735 [Enterobacter cloacae]QLU91554.1 hypothetical protein HV266_08320 [Enterobacter roggenkampii]DAF10907.1 MAG TPA: hypothetical protein [Caudoviricetes sp.]HED3660522.1 hypothetical protein [Enterobacter hormaechei subsp. hoffmannii]KJQ06005.1 hypothetical protein VE18_23855 [Enterobacter hormaechei]